MRRKSSAYKHPIPKHRSTSVTDVTDVTDVAPPEETIQAATSTASDDDSFAALLESVAKPILAVTYWFDPELDVKPYPVTVRFSGRRADAKGRLHNQDRFVQDETIEKVVLGSGPISVIAKVHDINPGKWTVTAQLLASSHVTQKTRKQEQTMTVHTSKPGLLPCLWQRWTPVASSDEHLKTCLSPCLSSGRLHAGTSGYSTSTCRRALITIDRTSLCNIVRTGAGCRCLLSRSRLIQGKTHSLYRTPLMRCTSTAPSEARMAATMKSNV